MLIACSGSQGSGKSTIISKLSDMGFNTITRKTSRSILEEWNLTLDEVNNDPDLTVKFQEEISLRKSSDEREAQDSDELWFTERTHADLFTYSLVNLGNQNAYSEWLSSYYTECMQYNQIYSGVFFLRAGKFNVSHDGVRGSGAHYSRMIDLTMLDITRQMIHQSKLTVVETPDLEQRVNMIAIQSSNIKR